MEILEFSPNPDQFWTNFFNTVWILTVVWQIWSTFCIKNFFNKYSNEPFPCFSFLFWAFEDPFLVLLLLIMYSLCFEDRCEKLQEGPHCQWNFEFDVDRNFEWFWTILNTFRISVWTSYWPVFRCWLLSNVHLLICFSRFSFRSSLHIPSMLLVARLNHWADVKIISVLAELTRNSMPWQF